MGKDGLAEYCISLRQGLRSGDQDQELKDEFSTLGVYCQFETSNTDEM